jgi:hypothetical protein
MTEVTGEPTPLSKAMDRGCEIYSTPSPDGAETTILMTIGLILIGIVGAVAYFFYLIFRG